ncbi:hypothetical protein B0H13DRAFT_1892373 [Mycena leptocephala]|nr:hypothetical protein B0H13DRAFT_1892373 [Mycena leptocephala]
MDPYKDIVYAHMDIGLAYSSLGITGIFTSLRRRCAIAANALTDAANFYESAFFKESGLKSGLGGWGEASTQFCILNGGFSASSSFWRSYPFPHTLRRKFNLFPRFEQVFPVLGLVYNHTRPANASFINRREWKEWSQRGCGLARVMRLLAAFLDLLSPPTVVISPIIRPLLIASSLLDPLIWLHHAMIDRIWFKWQKKHKLNKYAFDGGSVQRFENTTIFSQYLNGGPPYLTVTTEGPLCYVYD